MHVVGKEYFYVVKYSYKPMEEKIVKNQNFPQERALYGLDGISLFNCSFDGEEDGESALKECSNIKLYDTYMNLRYPLWHDEGVYLERVEMTDKCRAALWYTNSIKIVDSKLLGIKALRECMDIEIYNTKIVSPEFGWRSHNIVMENDEIEGEYLFFQSTNIKWKNNKFKGKYSFQYVHDLVIEDCYLDTKDAFWHSENVTVKNSVVKGEYLAWYANNLTLINCKIIGTQPLCYCKNLKLIDCEMVDTDFSFEYSEVEATIKGGVLSIKNPLSGHIVLEKESEIMLTKDSKYPCNCLIEVIPQ